ncbi:hypothetical protein CFOL_v3_24663 [Cephalotus follicularis]|uniref:RVP_2 domain-containing protein n=1 Tax=Cephalotus follicularis TaxID=3775 RepID=A0A1Q3CLS9_CEPFO|nr:hypothetical protein CFOL_v3_24663 [Cephalotus follicularis]
MTMHIQPLYVKAFIDEKPVSKVLVDNGAAINIFPYSMTRLLQKSANNLILTEVTNSNFAGGITQGRGVLATELTIGGKTSMTCIPSSLHQCLILWNGGNVEVV